MSRYPRRTILMFPKIGAMSLPSLFGSIPHSASVTDIRRLTCGGGGVRRHTAIVTDRRPETAYATVSLKKAMTFVQASSAWLSR